MPAVTLNDVEKACIHQLAEWYPRQASGPCEFSVSALATALLVGIEDASSLVITMETLGCVTDVY